MNDILELLESLSWIAVFTPPIAVFYFLIYTLIRKGRFLPLIHAFIFAPVGFWIGADAGGGFNQSGGWGFGNFAALLIGVWAAFLGFLLGLAVGFFFSKRWKTGFAAAAFVAGSLLYLFLHQLTVPLLLDAEYRRIEKILVKGWQPNEIHYARKRLAKIRPRVEKFAISYPLEDLPPASIQTLYKLRIIDGGLQPMSPAVARIIFEINGRDIDLAGNPDTPAEIILEMAENAEIDMRSLHLIRNLVKNPVTPDSEVVRLLRMVEELLASLAPGQSVEGTVSALTYIAGSHDLELMDKTWKILLERELLNRYFNKLPFPEWVAREIYHPEDRNSTLAANPSIPSDLISATLRTIDFQDPKEYDFLDSLIKNPNLSSDDLLFLQEQATANQESQDRYLARQANSLAENLEQMDRVNSE